MGLMKKLTSALVASSLVLSLVGSAFAAYTPGAGEEAGKRMQDLKIIQGRDGGDLALNSEITRAELVTTIVRAFGQEETAKYLVGSAIFPDTANHWASGNIAMAVKLVKDAGGDAIGMPDGTFAPDAKLTPAQAVAFLMKFVGVKRDATKAWPNDYLDPAVAAGLITAEDKALIAAETGNATRGLTFYLFDNAFYNYKLADGKTFYTKYVSPAGPSLTVADLPATTMDSKVTVTGNAKGAYEVYVGSQKVTVDASGNFSAEFALPEVKADPYTVTVTAVDRAGARVEKSATISRVVGDIATVEAEAITVAAGATVDVAVAVKDEAGNKIADAAVTGESGVGTFADGKFTAGKVAGTGTLKLVSGEATTTVNVTVTAGQLAKVVADKASAAAGEIVTLSAQDEFGNTITGATFAQASADAMLDGTTGKFMASKPGSYKVTATVGGVTKEYNVGVYSSTLAKYGVVASAANIISNNASTFTVTVSGQDANGNLIATDASTIAWGATAVSQFEVKNSTGAWVALNAGTAPVTLKDGTLTVTLRTKSGVLGGQISEISANLATDVNKAGKTTIELVDQVATSVSVTTDDKFVANNAGNENATFAIEVLDQAGKVMTTGAWAVKATVTGPAVLVDSTADGSPATSKDLTFTGGVALNTFVRSKLGESGTVTVTAAVEGLGSSTASVTATAAQAASKLEITSDKTTATANNIGTITYTLRVTDANGVPVVAEPTNIVAKFNLTDDNYAQISTKQFAAADDETYEATYTAVGATKKVAINFLDNGTAELKLQAAKFVGDLKVTFVDEATSGKLTGGESTISYTADSVAKVGLSRTTNVNVPSANPTVSLTAQLYDGAGNVAKVAGKKLTFASASSDVNINGAGKTVDVYTDAEGKATVNVTVLGYVGPAYVYTVTVSGSSLAAVAAGENDVTITPSNAVANSIELAILNALNNQTSVATANETLTLKATVKDMAGKVLPGETVTVKVTEGKTVATVTLTDNADGTYTGTFKPQTAGRLTLTVTDGTAAADVSAPVSINVRAAVQAAVKVERADYNSQAITTTKGAAKAFRVIPVDANNNVSAKTDAALTVSFAVTGIDGGKYFEIRSSADGANLISGGTATITIPAGSTGVTFYVLSNDETGVDVTVTANAGLGDGTLVFTAQ